MRTPPKKVYVMMHDESDCEYPMVAESEYEAARMVEDGYDYGPVFVYERVAGPFKMEIKREAVVTPIVKRRRRAKK